MWRNIRESLDPTLGEDAQRDSISSWTYRTPIRRWTVKTQIWVSAGPERHLAYDHSVSLPRRNRNWDGTVAWMLSALDWMHLGTTTDWQLSSEEDIPAAAASLAMACQRFVDGAPRLLP
jgi:hypothetical protein